MRAKRASDEKVRQKFTICVGNAVDIVRKRLACNAACSLRGKMPYPGDHVAAGNSGRAPLAPHRY